MFFSMDDLPPEIQEQIEQHRQHHEMVTSDRVHAYYRFMEEQTEDNLMMIRSIIRSVADEGPMGPHVVGVINAILYFKFGHCLACGKKHDDELAEMAAPSEESPIAWPLDYDPNESDQNWANFISTIPTTISKTLATYNVAYKVREYPKVVCQGCGKVYPEIADRTRRKPDECEGCHEKSAWG